MIIVGIDPSLSRSAYSVINVNKDFTLQLLNKNFTLQNKNKSKYFSYINQYENINKYFSLLRTSYFKTSPKDNQIDRLNKIYHWFYNEICNIKYSHKDLSIYIEESFVSNNSSTSITLGMVRSAVVLACLHSLNNLISMDHSFEFLSKHRPQTSSKICFLSATNIKKTLCNNGKAEKKEISKAVKQIFTKENLDENDYDVMDAIAIAMCGAIKEINPI